VPEEFLPTCTTWLVLRHDGVPRSYAFALIELIAPQLDRRDLQRALNGEAPAQWPQAPLWSKAARFRNASTAPAGLPARTAQLA